MFSKKYHTHHLIGLQIFFSDLCKVFLQIQFCSLAKGINHYWNTVPLSSFDMCKKWLNFLWKKRPRWHFIKRKSNKMWQKQGASWSMLCYGKGSHLPAFQPPCPPVCPSIDVPFHAQVPLFSCRFVRCPSTDLGRPPFVCLWRECDPSSIRTEEQLEELQSFGLNQLP